MSDIWVGRSCRPGRKPQRAECVNDAKSPSGVNLNVRIGELNLGQSLSDGGYQAGRRPGPDRRRRDRPGSPSPRVEGMAVVAAGRLHAAPTIDRCVPRLTPGTASSRDDERRPGQVDEVFALIARPPAGDPWAARLAARYVRATAARFRARRWSGRPRAPRPRRARDHSA